MGERGLGLLVVEHRLNHPFVIANCGGVHDRPTRGKLHTPVLRHPGILTIKHDAHMIGITNYVAVYRWICAIIVVASI
jgi:hypothetical protein